MRAAVQLVFFLFFPSAYTAAFAGVKYIFTQIGAGEKVEMTSFTAALIVLCLYTVVFGRFFCGFACAFGTLGDAVRGAYVFLCRKRKRKPVTIPEKAAGKLSVLKYVVLAAIVLLCFTDIYGKIRGSSPWDVFSMLHAGNFRLRGYGKGVILLLFLLVGMCVQERFFCRTFCPMGAVFSLLPVLPFFSLHRDRESCIKGCSACTKKCPSGIGLPEKGSMKVEGDCFQCQKCIDTCPRENIRCGTGKLKGTEIAFTIVKVAILLAIFVWIGI